MLLNPVVYVDIDDALIRSFGSKRIQQWRRVELQPDEAAAVPYAQLARSVRERP